MEGGVTFVSEVALSELANAKRAKKARGVSLQAVAKEAEAPAN
jgi:hypothetical protein